MKPMGLDDPRTGRRPYAVVQLRQENQRADSYNLVGFQNHMRFGDQARVFRLIPDWRMRSFCALARCTATPTSILRRCWADAATAAEPRVFFAGQISGVEGYAESIATGLIAGRNAAWLAEKRPRSFPRETALGIACATTSRTPIRSNFQPANITFDLLPALDEETKQQFKHDKKARHAEVCRRAKCHG